MDFHSVRRGSTRATATTTFGIMILLVGGTAGSTVQSTVSIPPPMPLNTNAVADSGDDGMRDHLRDSLRSGKGESLRLCTDGRDTWVAAWVSNDGLDAMLGDDRDILFARSTDNGGTWSAPAALNNNADSDSGDDYYPRLATDGDGTWLALWSSEDELDGTMGTDSDILVARSVDDGATWTAPASVSPYGPADAERDGDSASQVLSAGGGTWLAVWRASGSLGDVFCRVCYYPVTVMARSDDDGESWTEPVLVGQSVETEPGGEHSRATADQVGVYVSSDDDGNWLAHWIRQEYGDMYLSRSVVVATASHDLGATWTESAFLEMPRPFYDVGACDFATDRAGNWLAIAITYDSFPEEPECTSGFVVAVAASPNRGATWSQPAMLQTGRWPERCASASPAANPALATDGQGTWIAVWSTNVFGAGVVGEDYDLLFTRSSDNGATWSEPSALNTNAATDSGDDREPTLIGDALGGWFAIWQSTDDLGGTIGDDQDLLFAYSADTGVTWSDPAPFNSNAASDSGEDHPPTIVPDGRGTYVAAWRSNDDLGGTIGTDDDLLYVRFALPDCNANGIPDYEDIAVGTSLDVDGNGVPDECEFTDPDGENGAAQPPCFLFGLCAATLFLSVWSATRSRWNGSGRVGA